MIPYGRQHIDEDDIASVIDTLKSDFLTQGPQVPLFEENVKNYVSAKYAVAVNSATSALHIACLSLGLKENDILWTTPISFAASANCALYCGAKIDFVDIDLKTHNICVDTLKNKLADAQNKKKLPKVLIVVHMGGQSCDMKSIYELCEKYNVKIIEDASHAIGASYNEQKVGSCFYSDITVFSFHPVKIITTGEGGVATTNDKNLYQKLQLFRSHGITKDLNLSSDNIKTSKLPWFYEQIVLGYNYRMTDISAALGISQLKKIDEYINKRQLIAEKYDDAFKNLDITLPIYNQDGISSLHLYVIKISENRKNDHPEIFQALRDQGIYVQLHYIPIYHHPYYRKLGFYEGYCPNAENYYSRAISLPIFYDLKAEEQDFVIQKMREFI